MNSTENNSENVELGEASIVLRVQFWEGDISEAIYKFWCVITGCKFERRRKDRPNSCVLVTKTGFYLISRWLSRNMWIMPRQLKAYQMNCPEKIPFGLGQTVYKYRFFKSLNCQFCGRCFEVQAGDKKIVGKF